MKSRVYTGAIVIILVYCLTEVCAHKHRLSGIGATFPYVTYLLWGSSFEQKRDEFVTLECTYDQYSSRYGKLFSCLTIWYIYVYGI